MAASNPESPRIALAAVAHPDDIEFCFAGTLLRLRDAGYAIHMWNLANGSCGSATLGPAEIARVRASEAQAAAEVAGATSHPPLFDDLAVFYDAPSLARVSGVLRTIQPQVILTHAPSDYMEDHQNVCRLIVTAAFARGMPNQRCEPATPPWDGPVRLYHAAPHGHRDALGERFRPDLLVDIDGVHAEKRRMLARHESQARWLEASQGMASYLEQMEAQDREMARLGPPLVRAEGWRRHAHLGFCPPEFDPLVRDLERFVQRPLLSPP